jgi:DNA-directed RNA polymerase subunit RPC12/RpoP
MGYTCATCKAKANELKLVIESWMKIAGKYYCSSCGLDKLNENKKKDGKTGIHTRGKGKS